MLGGIISLASYYSVRGIGTGGAIGNLFYQLEQQGVFAYVLPFLMIFMVLYGILTKINIFRNKAIHVVLSLVVALMALQLNFVSYFFAEIFPRMGILLSIILVLIILVGLFWDFENSKWIKFVMGALMTIGVIVIVVQSFGQTFMFNSFGSGWAIRYWFERNLGIIITFVLLVGGIIAVVASGKKDTPKGKDGSKKLADLFEDMVRK